MMNQYFMNGSGSSPDDDYQELLQAQAHIWNHTFQFINSMSLKCAVELRIPDIIHSHGKPMTLSELVSSLSIPTSKAQHIYRIIRLLTHSGFFILHNLSDNEKGYALTPSSRLLLKSNPFNASPLMLFVLDPIVLNSWQCLSSWFLTDDCSNLNNPFEVAHGKSIWESAASEPRINDVLNKCMASDCLLVFGAMMSKCREVFEGLNSIVDVGGGTGTMAMAIAKAFPEMDCTVFDLPHVVDKLQGSKNLKFVCGNMFEYIPPADAILLKWILHDWSDEHCIKILKQCKKAIKSHEQGVGKVIIIEIVMDNYQGTLDAKKSIETQMMLDLKMMTLATGRERNEKEWAKLFFDVGFSIYKIYPVVGLRSLIEVYP